MSTYEHLTKGSQRPAEAPAEPADVALLDAEEASAPASTARTASAWQRRALTAGLALVGIAGCAYGANQLLAKPSAQPQAVHGELDVLTEFEVTGQVPAFVKWSKGSASECWAIAEENVTNGLKLHTEDCAAATKFLVPAGSTGPIRPAKYPDFCLDAPAGSTVIQLYKCADAPPHNIAFLMPDDRMGEIKPANNEEKCMDVPGGNTSNWVKIQQWDCTDKARRNENFTIVWPEDCEWEEWSEWSCCKDHHKTRLRNSSAEGDPECSGYKLEKKACSESNCDELGDDSAGAACQLSRSIALGLCLLGALALPSRW